MSINPNLNGELRVTVVATGLTGSGATAQMPTLAQPNSAGNPRVAQFIRPAEPAMYGQSQQSYGHGMGSQHLDIPPAQRMNPQSTDARPVGQQCVSALIPRWPPHH